MNMPALHAQPAWFGTVMGTGATSTLLFIAYHQLEWQPLLWISIGLLWGATLLAFALWPKYFRRLSQRSALADEIADPAHGAMLATFPAGVLVLANAWGNAGQVSIPSNIALIIGGVLAVIGAVIALGYSALWASVISRVEVPLAKINGGWLIPVIMNLLVPLALLPLIAELPDQARMLIAVGFMFMGIGVLLFVAVFTLLIVRIATQGSLPGPLVPSLWIPLAPAGVFGIAIVRLFQEGAVVGLFSDELVVIAEVVALMAIGFGLWWAIFAAIDLHRARKVGGIPFHLGWWGMVFPVVALATSITLMDQIFEFPTLIAIVAVSVGFGVWLFVSMKTLAAVAAERKRAASRH